MKKVLFILLGVLLASTSYAQDLITKLDGTDIKAKILEVNQTEIKYKKADYLDGPTFTMDRADILLVRYANGTNEVFNVPGQQQQPAYTRPAQQAQPSQAAAAPRRETSGKNQKRSSSSASAPKGLSVISGDYGILQDGGTAYVTIDYSNTMVGNMTLDQYLESQGPDFVRDWPKDQMKIREYFTGNFNRKNKKGMTTTENQQNADYDMVIHVQTLDVGNAISSFIPLASAKAGGVILCAVVEILDPATGQNLLTLEANDVKGVGHVSETVRIGMSFFELAKLMSKK